MADINSNALPLSVKPKTAAALLGVGVTRLYELLNSGELSSYQDGRSRLVPTASLQAYIAKRVAVSKPPKAA